VVEEGEGGARGALFVRVALTCGAREEEKKKKGAAALGRREVVMA
jgi:hypothetical protein